MARRGRSGSAAGHARLRAWLVANQDGTEPDRWPGIVQSSLLLHDWQKHRNRPHGGAGWGKTWRHIFPPVLLDFAPDLPVNVSAPFSTVMNWRAHRHVVFNGVEYGQKEMEFGRFIDLPRKTPERLQIAVSGPHVPREELMSHGWSVLNADDISASMTSYKEYLLSSKGEFAVAKHVFVATNSGWLGHQEGYYMATGRPVVLDDTGFGVHLPVGCGLFAVRDVDEAAHAFAEINGDFNLHSRTARNIATEFLDASRVLASFLKDFGIS